MMPDVLDGLCPGDLLVVRWATLPGQPIRTYFIIVVENSPEGLAVWYYVEGTEALRRSPVKSFIDAFYSADLDIIEVISVS